MIINGETENKLDLIKNYSTKKPYVVGENNVVELTKEYVVYVIDNIKYKTYFKDLKTLFSYEVDVLKNKNESSNLIFDDSFNYHDKTQTKSFINVQRNNFSVFEKFFYLSNANNLGDIENIPSNIFNF